MYWDPISPRLIEPQRLTMMQPISIYVRESKSSLSAHRTSDIG